MNLFIINLITLLSNYVESKIIESKIVIILNHILFFKQNQQNYTYELYVNNNLGYIMKINDFNILSSEFDNENSKMNINLWFQEKDPFEYIYYNIKDSKYLKDDIKIFKNYLNYNLNGNNLFDNNKIYNNVINLFSHSTNLLSIFFNNNIKYNNILCCDNNVISNKILRLYTLLKYNIDLIDNILETSILNDNHINNSYDLVICDIPSNFKNIIYANCNNIIKNIKIRGTKSEPLILQFILQILNKNGEILLFAPNSLLFGESKQHILTRKFLLESFNLTNIIEYDNKKSLLRIINNKNFTNITVSKNNMIFTISSNMINKNNYNLYFNCPINTKCLSNNKINMSSVVNVLSKNQYNNNSNTELLIIYNFNSLRITKITNDTDFIYVLITKDESKMKQLFLNLYLFELINKNINLLVKGKMEKISIDLLNNLNIKQIEMNTQTTILKSYDLNKTIIELNNQQISNYNNIKNIIDNIIHNAKTVPLSSIFNITNTLTNNTKIIIKKNSLHVGIIKIANNLENIDNNLNYFYLNTDKFNEYYYYILCYFQGKIINNAFKNKSISLSKTFLENLEIPLLSSSEKEYIIDVLQYISKQIDLLQTTNSLLLNTNLMRYL